MKSRVWLLGLAAACCFVAGDGRAQVTPTPAPPTPVPNPVAAVPKVTLPAAVAGDPKEWIVVRFSKVGGGVKWRIDPGLEQIQLGDLFGDEVAAKATAKVFRASKPGVYRVWAWNAVGSVASELAECVVTVGTPEPDDEEPGPGPGPGPTPTAQKLFVSIWWNKANADPKIVPVVESNTARTYLKSKASGFRVYNAPEAEPAKFAQFKPFIDKAGGMPCLVIQTNTGNAAGEKVLSAEKLPATEAALLETLKKFGG